MPAKRRSPTRKSADQSKLQALLESAVDAIISIRADGTIETVNQAASTLFQYDTDEFIGRNVNFLMPEPFRSEHNGYIARYLETGEKRIIGLGREVTGMRKDGTTFPMHLSVSEFEADGDRFFTGIVHDMTARKDAESALQQVAKLDAVGQLTGGVAHDFNNLLTIIIGNLELLELQLDNGSGKELLSEALEAAELGAKLTERLLAFARRSQLDPHTVDLNELALSLTDLLHRTLGETISLSTVLSTDLWPTRADPGQVESAIVNLAINARDAMPDGGKLVLETQNVIVDEGVADETGLGTGEYVQVSVTDTGTGMTEEVLARAFEPFFTTKDAGRGTGLGLSMAYGFAKQSGGHLSVYSEPGKGTTVNLYLPSYAGSDDGIGGDGPESGTGREAKETVLVVEDNDRVRKLTVSRIEELGYEVHAVASGPDALDCLRRKPDIDLLFTDLVMPGGMSGYDLSEEVRRTWPNIKVLLTSGYAENVTHGERLAKEHLELLRKPYRLAALAGAIRKVLDG